MNRPKKLILNRETLRDLTNPDLLHVEGGKGGPPQTAGKNCYTTDPSDVPCQVCQVTC